MARRIRDTNLESRSGRERLKPRRKPYYKSIGAGLHLGYRRNRNGGVWVLRRYVSEGNYEISTFADADDRLEANGESVLTFYEAQSRARDLHKKAEAGEPVGPITVETAMADYMVWLKGHRKSWKDAEYRINAMILPELGSVEISKLTATRLREWQQKIADTPPRVRTKIGKDQKFRELPSDPESIRKRRATTNRTLNILKAALNFSYREGKISSDSAWRRVQPFRSADAAKIRFLTIAEAKRLVNSCGDLAFRRLVQGALESGCRYGELAVLEVADFNADSGTIHIRESKSSKQRHVVLSHGGVALFKELIAGRQGSELMFKKQDGEPWGKSHQSRPMLEACERAKITPAISFHILRHCWAGLAVGAGVPLQVVARNLGHADSRMTERHYSHLAPSVEADMIRRGAPQFGFGPTGNVVGM